MRAPAQNCVVVFDAHASRLPAQRLPPQGTSNPEANSQARRCRPAQVIIIEGILVLHFRSILERAHMKIFVDSDDDVRLARRIKRDVAERGRDISGVLHQYTRFVKPSHDEFIAPSRRTADIVIPWQRGDNLVAVDLVVGHLRSHIVSDVLVSRRAPDLSHTCGFCVVSLALRARRRCIRVYYTRMLAHCGLSSWR